MKQEEFNILFECLRETACNEVFSWNQYILHTVPISSTPDNTNGDSVQMLDTAFTVVQLIH
jgi:hypothetical protein